MSHMQLTEHTAAAAQNSNQTQSQQNNSESLCTAALSQKPLM